MENSKINKIAAMRIVNSPFGEAMLQMFQGLEEEMTERGGAVSFFGQMGFINPGDPLEEGDLIPSVHFSLQPFQPVLSETIELVAESDNKEE